jgi:hypothetical protein
VEDNLMGTETLSNIMPGSYAVTAKNVTGNSLQCRIGLTKKDCYLEQSTPQT